MSTVPARAPDYDKVALLVTSGDRILLCRKKHTTSLLILPGGCREAGETPIDCLQRELREELGDVKAEGLKVLGVYTNTAAGSEDKTVRIELYAGELLGTPMAQSEIAELVWFGPDSDWTQLAPSLATAIIPDLIARGILAWC